MAEFIDLVDNGYNMIRNGCHVVKNGHNEELNKRFVASNHPSTPIWWACFRRLDFLASGYDYHVTEELI